MKWALLLVAVGWVGGAWGHRDEAVGSRDFGVFDEGYYGTWTRNGNDFQKKGYYAIDFDTWANGQTQKISIAVDVIKGTVMQFKTEEVQSGGFSSACDKQSVADDIVTGLPEFSSNDKLPAFITAEAEMGSYRSLSSFPPTFASDAKATYTTTVEIVDQTNHKGNKCYIVIRFLYRPTTPEAVAKLETLSGLHAPGDGRVPFEDPENWGPVVLIYYITGAVTAVVAYGTVRVLQMYGVVGEYGVVRRPAEVSYAQAGLL